MTPEFDFDNEESYKQPLSEEFIERNSGLICWSGVSIHQKLSEEFIERNSERVNWNGISQNQKLSEEFIERNSERVNWLHISRTQKLSESLIERHPKRVIWKLISASQKLSEEFIERNFDRVWWPEISMRQKLSESFIERNLQRVVWNYISAFQKLSEEFKARYLPPYHMNNWLYTKKETKRKAIEDCGLYTLDGDYVIAYKGIRSDGYSKFNFQYHYELGGIYEAHANHNLHDENSFGLSAWTEMGARGYCNEKLIKVKIHLDDVAALVHDGGKIRCSRFEVIEEL